MFMKISNLEVLGNKRLKFIPFTFEMDNIWMKFMKSSILTQNAKIY